MTYHATVTYLSAGDQRDRGGDDDNVLSAYTTTFPQQTPQAALMDAYQWTMANQPPEGWAELKVVVKISGN